MTCKESIANGEFTWCLTHRCMMAYCHGIQAERERILKIVRKYGYDNHKRRYVLVGFSTLVSEIEYPKTEQEGED